ncbi:hypothetical protein KKD03_03830 [Patescibacteria group bacterium]|nr:hypothetical protein [Patescibacteria group bacterium]
MSKRVLFFLVLMFAVLFISASGVFAAPNPPPPTPVPSEEPVPSEKNEAWGPSYDQDQIDDYRIAIETDNCATPSLECLVHQTSRFVAIEWVNSILYPGSKGLETADSGFKDSKLTNNQGSFVGGITYLIGEMYRYPAARTSVYIADVLENAHIITPAYAQGLGFASLNPVLDLWKDFRNVSYMLFVLIFIVLGFMIMFRQKIGGQSAVTAQQAIPSVIASLIFVTFSYAIAGFLIDLMYLLMFMMIGIFGQTAPGLETGIIDYNILDLMGKLFKDVSGFSNNIDIVTNLMGSMVESEGLGNALGIVGGVTLSLVLAVAILIGTFKLFFELLKSYATIVLSVVTAPLLLLGGAFPGKNVFGPWIKNLIGNLSAFPTVLMVVILFYQFTKEAPTTGGFIPPFLLGRGQAGAITTLMGLAIILALPEIVKEVKKTLGATEGFGTMVFNAAGARAKEGFPLGGRVGLGGTGAVLGGVGGAAIGGTGGFIAGAKNAGTILSRRQGLRKAGGALISDTFGGAMSGYKYKDKDGNDKKRGGLLGGVRSGAGIGIRATSEIASRTGIRQPDYLNPATNAIDKLDPKTAEKEKNRQIWEDRIDLLKKNQEGT